MKRGVSSAMRFGALGVKIICSGRLGESGDGPEPNGIARAGSPCIRLGQILITALSTRALTYGVIGVKVFIFKGEILKKDEVEIGAA